MSRGVTALLACGLALLGSAPAAVAAPQGHSRRRGGSGSAAALRHGPLDAWESDGFRFGEDGHEHAGHGTSPAGHSHAKTHSGEEQHTCIHDHLHRAAARGLTDDAHNARKLVPQSYANVRRDGHGRTLAATQYSPIRIRVDTQRLIASADTDPSGGVMGCTSSTASYLPTTSADASASACTASDVLTDEKRAFITDTLVPAAVRFFETSLSVLPVTGSLSLGPGWDGCSGFGSYNRFVCCGEYWNANYAKPWNATDFLIVLTARPIPGSTIAWALECQADEYGRPIAGQANLSPSRVSTDPKQFQNQLSILIHEMMHALGFSSSKFSLFRQPNTLDPVTSLSDVVLTKTDASLGKRVSKIITFNVVKQAQAQYNCYSWPDAGMELEDYGDAGTAGSHWDKRIAMLDIMNPVSEPYMYKSAITLGYFKDSGWYDVSYAAVDIQPWGYGEGCGFVTQKCSTGWSSAYFCTVEQQQGCTADLRFQGQCGLQSGGATNYPSYEQYFADNPAKGGKQPHADYCPYYAPFSNRDCTDASTFALSFYGESPGPKARCFAGTYQLKTAGPSAAQHGGCLQTACSTTNQLLVTLTVSATSKFTVTCPRAGGTIDLATLSGSPFAGNLICPRSDLVCTGDPCALNTCSDHGTCQRTDGSCVCNTGFYGNLCQFKECPGKTVSGDWCSGHGACNNVTGLCEDGTGVPGCIGNWRGADCSQAVLECPGKLASGALCSGHGTCNDTTAVCTCAAGYRGADCSVVDCPSDCSGRGVCDTTIGLCTCSDGMDASTGLPFFYSGASCSVTTTNATRLGAAPKLVFTGETAAATGLTGAPLNATSTGRSFFYATFDVPSVAAPLGVTVTFPDASAAPTTAAELAAVVLVASYDDQPLPTATTHDFEGIRATGAPLRYVIDFLPPTNLARSPFVRTGRIVVALATDKAYPFTMALTRDGCSTMRCDFGTCLNGRCECDPGWSGASCAEPDCPGNPDCGGASRGTCMVPAGAYNATGYPRRTPTLTFTPVCACASIFSGLDCGTFSSAAVAGNLFDAGSAVSLEADCPANNRAKLPSGAPFDAVYYYSTLGCTRSATEGLVGATFSLTGTVAPGGRYTFAVIDRKAASRTKFGFDDSTPFTVFARLNASASPGADPILFAHRAPVSLSSIPSDAYGDYVAWRSQSPQHEVLVSKTTDSVYFISVHNGLYASTPLVFTLSGEVTVGTNNCPAALASCSGNGRCAGGACDCDAGFEGIRCDTPVTVVGRGDIRAVGPSLNATGSASGSSGAGATSSLVTATSYPTAAGPVLGPVTLAAGSWAYFVLDISGVSATSAVQFNLTMTRRSASARASPILVAAFASARGPQALARLTSASAAFDFSSYSTGAARQSLLLRRSLPASQKYLYIGLHNSPRSRALASVDLSVTAYDSIQTACTGTADACRAAACNGHGTFVSSAGGAGGAGSCKCDVGWDADSDCAAPGYSSFDNLLSAAQAIEPLCSLCNDVQSYSLGAFQIFSIPQTLQKSTALKLTVRQAMNSTTSGNATSGASSGSGAATNSSLSAAFGGSGSAAGSSSGAGGVPAMLVSPTLPRSILDFIYIAPASSAAAGGNIILDTYSPTGSYWAAVYANSPGNFSISASRAVIAVPIAAPDSFLRRVGSWLTQTIAGIIIIVIASLLGACVLVSCCAQCCSCSTKRTDLLSAKSKMGASFAAAGASFTAAASFRMQNLRERFATMENDGKQEMARYKESIYALHEALTRHGEGAFEDKPAIKAVASRAIGLRAPDPLAALPRKLSGFVGFGTGSSRRILAASSYVNPVVVGTGGGGRYAVPGGGGAPAASRPVLVLPGAGIPTVGYSAAVVTQASARVLPTSPGGPGAQQAHAHAPHHTPPYVLQQEQAQQQQQQQQQAMAMAGGMYAQPNPFAAVMQAGLPGAVAPTYTPAVPVRPLMVGGGGTGVGGYAGALAAGGPLPLAVGAGGYAAGGGMPRALPPAVAKPVVLGSAAPGLARPSSVFGYANPVAPAFS